jgi:hypothetical protein
MKQITVVLLFITIFLVPMALFAAEGDVRTCTLNKAIECVPDEECVGWTVREMALPRFVRIDLKAMTITSLDKEIARTSKISTVERLEGLTILHGTEQRGWSLALVDESGDFTLSASGENEGFVVFGSCMSP